MQEAALRVAVEEGDNAAALLGSGQRVVVRQFAREEQVGIHVAQHRRPAARADGYPRDLDVFYLPRLRDRDGEAFRVANAARDALDEVG